MREAQPSCLVCASESFSGEVLGAQDFELDRPWIDFCLHQHHLCYMTLSIYILAFHLLN